MRDSRFSLCPWSKKPIMQPTKFMFVEQQLLLIHALKNLSSVCFFVVSLTKGPNPSTAGMGASSHTLPETNCESP